MKDFAIFQAFLVCFHREAQARGESAPAAGTAPPPAPTPWAAAADLPGSLLSVPHCASRTLGHRDVDTLLMERPGQRLARSEPAVNGGYHD